MPAIPARTRDASESAPERPGPGPTHGPPAVSRFSQLVGRSRFIVLLAVAGVMLVAITLFLLGTV